MRKDALEQAGQWPHGYQCCQGHAPRLMCFKPGEMGEADNAICCLCMESYCCTGMAASGTYGWFMRQHGYNADPCYNRFVRFSNCMQCLACVCQILACFCEELQDAADCVSCIADIVFHCLIGCINAQVMTEIGALKSGKAGGYQQMGGSPGHGPPAQQMHGR